MGGGQDLLQRFTPPRTSRKFISGDAHGGAADGRVFAFPLQVCVLELDATGLMSLFPGRRHGDRTRRW